MEERHEPLLFRAKKLDERGRCDEQSVAARPGRPVDVAGGRPAEKTAAEHYVRGVLVQDDEPGFTRTLRHPVRHLVMDLTFKGPQPRTVDYWTSPQRDVAADAAPLRQPLRPAPYVQIVLTDPAPGRHGLEWSL